MKKIDCIFASALVLLGALQACTKTYVKEIVDENQTGNTVVEDDDISKLLKTIPGVSHVEIKLPESKTGSQVKQYFFFYTQPVDHYAPAQGLFYQRVALQLKDLAKPVVVITQGYELSMDGKAVKEDDLTTLLDANLVEIEFRYFGQSQPEDMNNVEFTYLYSDQSAYDIHNIVAVLKANVFKNGNKWIATGASKGGITSTLHAYYADLNGWKDFDLYVPFCAPFLPGSAQSPLDASVGKYVLTNCGAGYPAGSIEAVGYANLQKILQQSVSKPILRNAILCRFHQESPDQYLTIMNQLKGATEDRMLAGFLLGYMETLLTRFSDVPFSDWAQRVPDPDLIKDEQEESIMMSPLDQVLFFIFMSEQDFKDLVYAKEAGEDEDTKAIHTADDMLPLRNNPEYSLAYSVASVRELGAVGMDFSWLPSGSFLTPEVGYAVEYLATGRAREMDYYEGQWDGGKLMQSVRSWIADSQQKMVFVYGTNDPWTGGAIDDAAAQANPNVVKVLNFGGCHNDSFLNAKQFTPQARKQIEEAVRNFLK